MKKSKISLLIVFTFLLSLNLSGQTFNEDNRAEFLTKYYSKYQNGLNNNFSNDTVDVSRIEVKTIADSLMEAKKVDRINANCLNSLNNENKGVLESAIYVSIQFKNKFPNENVSTFVQALDRIIRENDDARIRYKAQLAKMYMTNMDWFENLEVNSIEFEKEVYFAIAQTLNGKLFSQNF